MSFSASKQTSAVVLAVFQGRYPRAIPMQPTRKLQWTTSENLIICFLENNNVQYGPTRNLFSLYLQFLHRGKDFHRSYITFNIFSNSTFFGTTRKTNENYKF